MRDRMHVGTEVEIIPDTKIAGLAETWFAWSGPTTAGSASYFRIQGPTLLIEYSPQRMRGGGLDPTHIHTIYRDPTNDYGGRLAKR